MGPATCAGVGSALVPDSPLPHADPSVKPVAQFSSAWETRKRPDMPPGKPIAKLKDMCIETVLVERGEPRCVVVAPAGERYREAERIVGSAIRHVTGVTLSRVIADGQTLPESILAKSNVIAFGNMHTNPLIFRLYAQWLTLLDLWWPGEGGYALLSLHNPYGTGRNVILVGGSDDAGVAASAHALARRIESMGRGVRLALGWLHDVKIGAGLKPPDVGDAISTWAGTPNDEGRPFGWNPISIYGCLYYMTGEKKYLDEFKRFAFSKPGAVPEELKTDYRFWNPANPLVENYHYYCHLVPYVWDLIEESPLFTDAERLYITNKLLEWQDHYDPHDNFAAPGGGRHEIYQMLGVYTGSLYFAKYYPSRRWQQRLVNCRAGFDWWLTNRTWGELDNISWINTSTEVILNFFLLDGRWERFVASGGAAEMMHAIKTLWTGKPLEESNKLQSLNMMHKAAYLLRDPGYVWLARCAPYDLKRFRVGQSWWPGPDLAPRPPADLVRRIAVQPLTPAYWKRFGEPFPLEQGYQFATYRNTLDAKGDFVQIDGTYLCPRLPYHLSSLYLVRIAGRDLLTGYDNRVVVRRQGMIDGRTPCAAALLRRHVDGRTAVFESRARWGDMADWTREVRHVEGERTVVTDRLAARSEGPLEVSIQWRLTGSAVRVRRPAPNAVVQTSTATLAASGVDEVRVSGHAVEQIVRREVKPGDVIRIVNVIAPAGRKVSAPAGAKGGKRIAEHGPEARTPWPPAWTRKLPARVVRLATTPAALGGRIWVACEGGLLLGFSLDGSPGCAARLGSEITTLCPAPDGETARHFAVLAGLDDDRLVAIDAHGEEMWEAKAEVDPVFWLGGHWRAPWFTDPASRHGVLSLLVARLRPEEPPEIVLGRACTVEFRSLDGNLLARRPARWGDAQPLAIVHVGGETRVLAGKFGAVGAPTVHAFGPEHNPRKGGYTALPPGFPRVGGWGNRVTPHIVTADLDRDGKEEVVLARTGVWNEIVAYDAASQACRWARSFGPGGAEFISGLAAADLDRDGKLEVAACARSGWVWLFSCDGKLRWATRLAHPATSLAVVRYRDKRGLVVADASGRVWAIDSKGRVQGCAWSREGEPMVKALEFNDRCRVFVCAGDEIFAFEWPSGVGAAGGRVQAAAPAKGPRLVVAGKEQLFTAFQAGRGRVLLWAQVKAKPGAYGGRIEVDAKPGATVKVSRGTKLWLDWRAAAAGAHTVALPACDWMSLPGPLCIEPAGPVTLRSARLDGTEPPDVVLAYWPFDEGKGKVARDASGHSCDATLHNVQWVRARGGYAVRLPSRAAFVEASARATERFVPRTIEAWIKPDRVGVKQAIVAQWRVSGNQRSFMLSLRDGRLVFRLSPDGAYSRVASVTSKRRIEAGRWHHVAATWDGEVMRVYIDGRIDPATARIARVFESSAGILLGRYETGYFYTGLLDDVRIYARALSPDEIRSHATARPEGGKRRGR